MQVEIAEDVGQLLMMSDNVISIQNINPINLIGSSVILYVLNMDSLHLEIEERISNAIRGFILEIKIEN